MAFFARRGKTDMEDYEAFHTKCGQLVTFSNGRRTVEAQFGVVYSEKPIPIGAKFQVKLVQRLAYPIVSHL